MKFTLTILLQLEQVWELTFYLLAICLRVLALSAGQCHDSVFLLLLESQQKLKTQIFIHLPKMFCIDYYILIYTYYHELMTSVESHGSQSLLVFMGDSLLLLSDHHKVITTLSVMLGLLLLGTCRIVASKCLLCSFLCRLIDTCKACTHCNHYVGYLGQRHQDSSKILDCC